MSLTTGTRQVDSVTIVDISGRLVFGGESASKRAEAPGRTKATQPHETSARRNGANKITYDLRH